MADLRYEFKNNQKKEVSTFASGNVTTSATMDDILFTLPEASLVTAIYAVTMTASGVASSTVDVKIGATVVANELDIAAIGTSVPSVTYTTSDAATVTVPMFTPQYFSTGGLVTVVAGAVAPDAAGSIKIVVEYTETELSEGSYTD